MQCKFLQIITSDKCINVNTIYREETDMTKYITKMYLFSLCSCLVICGSN